MFPVSIAYFRTFGYKSFKEDKTFKFLHDEPIHLSVLSNFADVANVKDVLADTKTALKKEPKREIEVGYFNNLLPHQQMRLIIYQGYLDKKGEDLIKSWKHRFCCLIQEPRGLIYYKEDPQTTSNSNEKVPVRGFVSFENITAIEPRKKKQFNIITPTRTWRFRAKSPQDRDVWIQKLRAAAHLNQKKT